MDWAAWMAGWGPPAGGLPGQPGGALRRDRRRRREHRRPGAHGVDLCCGPGSLGQRILRAACPTPRSSPSTPTRCSNCSGTAATVTNAPPGSSSTSPTPSGRRSSAPTGRSTRWPPLPLCTGWPRRPSSPSTPPWAAYFVVGGVFVDGDHLAEPATHPELRRLQTALRRTAQDGRPDYQAWWAQLEAAASPGVKSSPPPSPVGPAPAPATPTPAWCLASPSTSRRCATPGSPRSAPCGSTATTASSSACADDEPSVPSMDVRGRGQIALTKSHGASQPERATEPSA